MNINHSVFVHDTFLQYDIIESHLHTSNVNMMSIPELINGSPNKLFCGLKLLHKLCKIQPNIGRNLVGQGKRSNCGAFTAFILYSKRVIIA